MKRVRVKSKGKDYEYGRANYLDMISDKKHQRIFMKTGYHKLFKIPEKKGRVEMRKILGVLMTKIHNDIVLGATVNMRGYKLAMGKRRTTRKTSTVFNGILYVPIISYTNLVRMQNCKHDIKPTIGMQICIRKSYQAGNYENL